MHLLIALLLAADPEPPPAFRLEVHPTLQLAAGLQGELPYAASYRAPRLSTQAGRPVGALRR